MPEDIVTRFASAKDAGIVHDMVLALGRSMGGVDEVTSSVQNIENALSGNHPDINAIVAERGGAAVGMVIFFLTYSTWRGARGVYVQDIFVSSAVRGGGLGARLLTEVAAWGAGQEADHLRLSVDRDNADARSFYERNGLSQQEAEMIYSIADNSFTNLCGVD